MLAESRPVLTGKTVLIADDDPTVIRSLGIDCRGLGLKVESAIDGLQTLLKVSKVQPDLLILDLMLPDVDGFRVCERLKDAKFKPLPVIILTASSDKATIARCEALGALYVHKDERTWEHLEPLINRIFRERAASREAEPVEAGRTPRVLIVDDDPVALKSIAAGFRKYQVETIVASNGMQGFWLALKVEPDVIFTDYHMSGGDGHYLLSRIKSTPSTRDIPVVVFSARSLTEGERVCMQRDLRGRGQAAAFLTKPISAGALLEELRRHVQLPAN